MGRGVSGVRLPSVAPARARPPALERPGQLLHHGIEHFLAGEAALPGRIVLVLLPFGAFAIIGEALVSLEALAVRERCPCYLDRCRHIAIAQALLEELDALPPRHDAGPLVHEPGLIAFESRLGTALERVTAARTLPDQVDVACAALGDARSRHGVVFRGACSCVRGLREPIECAHLIVSRLVPAGNVYDHLAKAIAAGAATATPDFGGCTRYRVGGAGAYMEALVTDREGGGAYDWDVELVLRPAGSAHGHGVYSHARIPKRPPHGTPRSCDECRRNCAHARFMRAVLAHQNAATRPPGSTGSA